MMPIWNPHVFSKRNSQYFSGSLDVFHKKSEIIESKLNNHSITKIRHLIIQKLCSQLALYIESKKQQWK